MLEMKDSGVAWIGTVPSNYGTASIGSLFTIKKDIIGREPETVLSITQTGIRPKDLSSNEGQNASSYAHYQIVNVGDFAMNHMDLLTGWIDISKHEGVTSPDYRVFTLNDKEMSADYFLRVFQYYYSNRVFFGFGQGVATLGRWRLPAINFKKIDVPVPPILEQRKIVAAIDENVGKVDRLIANVQTQIEKLRSYKQSIITEVVTKGLDPTVPMKNSGVEWIGDMPAHWEMVPMKILGSVRNGLTYSPEDVCDEDGGTLVLRSSNIQNGQLVFDDNVYVSKYISEDLQVSENDILICSRNGSRKLIGKNAIIPDGIEASFGAFMMIFRTKHHPKYCKYILDSSIFQYYLGTYLTATINQLTAQNFNSMQAPFTFNTDEQERIVSYLDPKCSQIDRLIAIKQEKIEKLEQYKRSLIYEYVTGKQEVS